MDLDRPLSTQYPKVYITYKYPAKNVLIAGTFTGWTGIPMIKIYEDLWIYPLQLPPGTYQSKFIVDGIWCFDTEKPNVLLDNIRNNVLSVKEKTLVILRGVSGSGKTTLAKKLLGAHGGITFAEADKRMRNENGKYVFDPKKLTIAHSGSLNDVIEAIQREDGFIVVSNTSILYWEMYQYVKLALKYGYNMQFLEPETEWRYDIRTLLSKNEHNVPFHSIKSQLDNLRLNPTLPTSEMIAAILATDGLRPTIYQKGVHHTPWKLYYYGLSGQEISTYCDKLKTYLGDKLYTLFEKNRKARDGGKNVFGETIYHITLNGFHPSDKEVLLEEQLKLYCQKLVELESKPRWVGLGEVEKEGNKAYYVVVDWPEVNDIRHEFQLEPLDLHVTLGFDPNDVHGVSKGPDTVIIQ